MGLLDDAIREHLDLKRRRGADPTEVERAEREALGPVRRAPESTVAADDLAPEAEPADFHEPESEALAPEPAPEPDAYEPTEPAAYEPEPAASEPPPPAPAPDLMREPPRAPAFDQEDDASWSYGDAAAEPASDAPARPRQEPVRAETEEDVFGAPASPPPHPAPAPGGGETMEYDVEAALGSEPPAEGGSDEDVLEETPEFLQDTPDHDRLWFEQRPPKDFDFDG
jgi:hypothetical protein